MNESQKRKYFLSYYFDPDGLSLSDRITALAFQDIVADSLRIAMSQTLKFRELVKDLAQYTDQDELKGAIRDIIGAARRAMAGDTSGMAELRQALNAYDPGAPTGMTKAYNRIVKAAENLSSDALDAAVENAIDKKAMANAFRLANTEIFRAHNLGVYTEGKNDPDCIGMQIDLSEEVNNCDECIEIVEMDSGGGPGVYSMDNVPVLPVHPHGRARGRNSPHPAESHCRCLMTPVYKMSIDPADLEQGYEGDTMEALPE